MDADLTGAIWRKSTYSNGTGGDCVEIAKMPGGRRALRDSKNRHGPVLLFSASQWQAFTHGVKLSEPE